MDKVKICLLLVLILTSQFNCSEFPWFSNPEIENENKIDISQIGHYCLSKMHYKDESLLKKHFYSYKIIESEFDQAFVAAVGIHKNLKTLIVSFRGTYLKIENFLVDVIISKTKIDGPQDCVNMEVMDGFNIGYSQLKDKIFEEIKKQTLELKNSLTQIIFTGHSLGAAMAHIATLEYFTRKEKSEEGFNIPKVSLITFGSPRVGTKEFADCLIKRLYHNFRLIYNQDPIPSIPWRKGIIRENNFVHAGTELRYFNEKFDEPQIGKRNDDTTDIGWSLLNVYYNHTHYYLIHSRSIWNAIHSVDM